MLMIMYLTTKKVFDDAGFNPYAFRHLDEIEVLPFLTKELVQEHFDDLTADNIPLSRRTVDTTGGSSGNQLRFILRKMLEPSSGHSF